MTRSVRFGALQVAIAAAFAVALSGCGKQEKAEMLVIAVDGSSTVGPISKAVANAFNTNAPRGVTVTVAESGTGGGFSKFCQGITQVQDASRPITKSEMETCAQNGISYIELPIAFDALTVIVNPDNPVSEMTVADLKKIWEPAAENTIDNWKKLGAGNPDIPLHLYGPGTASGTFDYFTAAVVGEEGASRKDYNSSENDNNIILGVAGDSGALGYLGLAYYENNKDRVKAVAIKKDATSPAVLPSVETVQAGQYVPLARPIFIYVNADSLKIAPIKNFATFYIQNVAELSKKVGYVPLPESAYTAALARIEEGKTGTQFGGVADVSGSIEEVMSREFAK